jgi:RNase P/RNase MRP subunit POP5
MLRRREKQRYLAILHSQPKAVDDLQKRHAELFGQVSAKKAGIKEIKSDQDVTVIRCSQESIDSVLAAVALCYPPMCVLDASGTIKRLKRRLPAKVNTAASPR